MIFVLIGYLLMITVTYHLGCKAWGIPENRALPGAILICFSWPIGLPIILKSLFTK